MYKEISPSDYPLKPGESWWIIHPNSSGGEFIIPKGAMTICKSDFLDFKKDILYCVSHSNKDGWVEVIVKETQQSICMPQYLFARYFDAEIFIRGGIKELDDPPKAILKMLNWID